MATAFAVDPLQSQQRARLFHYVNETQRGFASHLDAITFFEPSEYLSLDSTTVCES
jgi:DNA mismatch repair ATPase MutS